MKCIECGHELKDGAIFCIRCGAMQVSMDGKPIDRQDGPNFDAKSDAAGFRSSTDGALHSAQAKNPRGFQPAPKRSAGPIVAVILVIIALIAVIAFALTQCAGQQSSSESSTESSTTAASTSSTSATSTSSTSSTAASTSSTSASATSTSASAASASAASAASTTTTTTTTNTSTTTEAPQQTYVEPEPVYSGNDYYVLPDSSYYYYSYDELNGMSTWDLYIARNEIFARHGRMFNRSDLQDYFNSQAWYEPIYTPAQYDSLPNQLTDAEMKNSILMKQVEADKGSPYL